MTKPRTVIVKPGRPLPRLGNHRRAASEGWLFIDDRQEAFTADVPVSLHPLWCDRVRGCAECLAHVAPAPCVWSVGKSRSPSPAQSSVRPVVSARFVRHAEQRGTGSVARRGYR